MRKTEIRRLLTLLLALVLTLNVASCFAEDAQYATTKDFIRALEDKGFKYTYKGIDSDKDEQVIVSFSDDYYDTIAVRFFFDEDEDKVSIRIWNLIDVSAGESYAATAVNKLNKDYKYAKFILDTSDSTISVENDIYADDTDGDKVVRLMNVLLQILTDDDCLDVMKTLK